MPPNRAPDPQLDETSASRCSHMLYEINDAVSFLQQCRSGHSGNDDDADRWDVLDRAIAHVFDVEARTQVNPTSRWKQNFQQKTCVQALVRRSLRLNALRTKNRDEMEQMSHEVQSVYSGAGDTKVFEICLEQSKLLQERNLLDSIVCLSSFC